MLTGWYRYCVEEQLLDQRPPHAADRGEGQPATTRLLWGFLVALVAIAAIDALAIVLGTDMDGSKTFISTAEDQRSLLAFGVNALLGTGLFGAIAVAREYGHTTVVPTFLSTPRRHLAMLARLTAVMIGGLVLGLLAEALALGVGAVSLQFTDYAFMLSAGMVAQLLATSMLAGAVGAVLGGGIGAIVRNGGDAVAVTILVLFIAHRWFRNWPLTQPNGCQPHC